MHIFEPQSQLLSILTIIDISINLVLIATIDICLYSLALLDSTCKAKPVALLLFDGANLVLHIIYHPTGYLSPNILPITQHPLVNVCLMQTTYVLSIAHTLLLAQTVWDSNWHRHNFLSPIYLFLLLCFTYSGPLFEIMLNHLFE